MNSPDTCLPAASATMGTLPATTDATALPVTAPAASSATTPALTVGIAVALGVGTAPAVSLGLAPALPATAPLPAAGAIFSAAPAVAAVAPTPEPSSVTAASLQHIRIKEHVPVVLDLKRSNYGRWSTLFNKVFGKHGLFDHIQAAPDAQLEDAEWMKVDFTVVPWLYTTVSDEILDIVLAPHDLTHVIWTKLASLFLDNMMSQAVYMEEFRSLQQGDMSVSDYCSRLKVLADGLRDVGVEVSEQSMLFNMLRGLGPALGHAIPVLTMQQPLPSFMRACSYLLLEEHRQEQTARRQAAAALYAARSDTPPQHPSSSPSGSPSGSPNKRNKKKKNGSTSTPSPGGSSCSVPATVPAPSQWPHDVNPWTGTFHAWPQLARAGVLGRHPPMAPTAPYAYAAGVLPPTPTTMAPSSSSSVQHGYNLDPNFIAAMHQLTPPRSSSGGGDWFLDTGASSHMSSNPVTISTPHSRIPSSHIIVGNGATLPITAGDTSISTSRPSFQGGDSTQ